MNELGKKAILQLVMILLLKHNDDGNYLQGRNVAKWGGSEAGTRSSMTMKNPTRQLNLDAPNGQDYEAKSEQNLYLRLVEPVSYLFQSKEQKPIVRYFAQECLAVMSLGCEYLDKSLVLEAVYETCLGD